MNPVVLLLANGNAFFLGIALTAASLLFLNFVGHPLMRSLIRVTGILGVGFVLASSTPLSLWIYGFWITLWLATWGIRERQVLFRYRVPVNAAFLLLSAGLCLLEAPHRVSPRIPIAPGQSVYVIGDSISAGMGTSERNWPDTLSDISRIRVINLAQPGATVASALSQAKEPIAPNSLVIIEIGGNDLFGNLPSHEFSNGLDLLLQSIGASHRIAMFELPLLPFHNGYGTAQRNIAKKHNVILIPKKHLTAIIGTPENTLDGLHLSQKGHDALANAVLGWLTKSEATIRGSLLSR